MEPELTAPATTALSAFIKGLGYPRRALRIIRADRVLLRYALLPFLINVFVFALAIAAFVYWFGDLWGLTSDWTRIARPEGWYWLPFYWVLAGVRWLLAGLLMIVALLITWFSFTLVGNVIASPFNELLSINTERRLRDRASPESEEGWRALLGEMARAVGDEARKMVFFLLVQAALLPLNFVPLIGTIVYTVLSLGFGVLFVALEFTDYPMARRRIPFAERRRAVWRHKALMSGFGGSLFLTFFIPGMNLICLPLGVVGGTLLYLDLAEGDTPMALPRTRGSMPSSGGEPPSRPG